MPAAFPVIRAGRPAGTAGRRQLPNCNCNCNILKKHQKILLFHKQKLIFVSLHKRKSLFCAFCTMPFFGLLRAFPGVLARCMASRSSAWQQGLSWRFYRPFLASWRAGRCPCPPPGAVVQDRRPGPFPAFLRSVSRGRNGHAGRKPPAGGNRISGRPGLLTPFRTPKNKKDLTV